MGRPTRVPEPFKTSGQAAPLKTTGRRAASWGVYGKTADCPLTAESQGRLPEKPALGSRPATPTNPMTSSRGTGQGSGYSEAHSRPLPRAGMATVRRTPEDLRAAWRCCHAGPDISTVGPNPAPMTACLYGLEAAGPTSQRDLGRQRETRQSDPSGVGPGESAEPSPGAHAPLIKM